MKMLVLVCGVLALLLIAAQAQLNIAGPLGSGSGFGASIIGGPSAGVTSAACVADGKTDWSKACDIPLGVALGVL